MIKSFPLENSKACVQCTSNTRLSKKLLNRRSLIVVWVYEDCFKYDTTKSKTMCYVHSCTLLRSWDWNMPSEFVAWFLNLKWCGAKGFRNTFHNTGVANNGKCSYWVTLDTNILMPSCGMVSIFISSNKHHLRRLHLFKQSLLLNALSLGVPHFTQYSHHYPVICP